MTRTAALEELFVLHEPLGRGGMGVVYRATQRSLDRVVALKVLSDDLAADPEYRTRFIDEARLASSVNHRAVVRVLDFAVLPEGCAYIAYELVPGVDLDQLLASGPLPIARALPIVRDLLSGLSALHERGILHRDVKPANLLVGNDGRGRLIDLGIGREMADRRARTRTGVVMGTPGYIAPEQIAGDAASPALDVYAAGGVIYALACGRPPFDGENPVVVMAKQLESEPPSPLTIAPSADPTLAKLALAALARRPQDRPTIAELEAQLAAAHGDSGSLPKVAPVPSPARRSGGTFAPTRPVSRPAVSSRPGTVARPVVARGSSGRLAACVVILVLALAAAAFALRGRPETPLVARATPSASAAPRPGRLIDAWRRAEKQLQEVRRNWQNRPANLVKRVQQLIPEVRLGLDPRIWVRWLEIGEWLDDPARPEPVLGTRGEEGYDELTERAGMSLASSAMQEQGVKFFIAALRVIDTGPRDARGWLMLARYLELEGDPRAERCYRFGMTRPEGLKPMVGISHGWAALGQGLRATGLDLAAEYWTYLPPDDPGRAATEGIRLLLAESDPALLDRILRAGVPHTQREPFPAYYLASKVLEGPGPAPTRAEWSQAIAELLTLQRATPHRPPAIRKAVEHLLLVGEVDAARSSCSRTLFPPLHQVIDVADREPTIPVDRAVQGHFDADLAGRIEQLDACRLLELGRPDEAARIFRMMHKRSWGEAQFLFGFPFQFRALGGRDPQIETYALEVLFQSTPERTPISWDLAAGALAVPAGADAMRAYLAEAAARKIWFAPHIEALWTARTGRAAEALAMLERLPAPAERHEAVETCISEVVGWGAWTGAPVPAGLAGRLADAPPHHAKLRAQLVRGDLAGAGATAAEHIYGRTTQPLWGFALVAGTRGKPGPRAAALRRFRAIARMNFYPWALRPELLARL